MNNKVIRSIYIDRDILKTLNERSYKSLNAEINLILREYLEAEIISPKKVILNHLKIIQSQSDDDITHTSIEIIKLNLEKI